MSAKIVWKAEELKRKIDERFARNLDAVGVYLQGKIVTSFGNPPPEPKKGGGYKKNSSKAWKRKHHSKPGETPYVQTGTLRRSIKYTREGNTLLIGSSLKPQKGNPSYAWMLEWGSPGGQLAPRPYLRPAVRNNKATIVKMLAR